MMVAQALLRRGRTEDIIVAERREYVALTILVSEEEQTTRQMNAA